MSIPSGSRVFSADMSAVAQARFLRRRNRFVVDVEIILRDGIACPPQRTSASLPNPGRLGEILLPDVLLNLRPGPPAGRHPWRVASARLPAGETVFLDTGRTNEVARYLIEEGLVPALAPYRVERAEAALPGTRSRIDFLLAPRCKRDQHERSTPVRYLEVKSCTLFNGPYAMFPDAVTERGRRHVEELARDGAGAVLFILHSDHREWFVPDYHSDLPFSRALAEARSRLPLIPVGVGWNEDGTLRSIRTDITIPWERVIPNLVDSGLYMILLSSCGGRFSAGALGTLSLERGWYLYVGSARSGLAARVARHRRRGRKKMHWHIDYLREECKWEDAFLIREEDSRREAELARAVAELAEGSVPRFGASDSPCDSHLFYFSSDPRRSRAFMELLLEQRRHGLASDPGSFHGQDGQAR